MIRLLVSIRSLDELNAVLDAQVELVDVKEPNHGALGAADCQVWQQIAAQIQKQAPLPQPLLSVACGELSQLTKSPDHNPKTEPAIGHWKGVQFAKVGLAHSNTSEWKTAWHRWADSLPEHVSPVIVAYADWKECNAPDPLEVIDSLRDRRTTHVLFDTAIKTNGSLFDLQAAKQSDETTFQERQQAWLKQIAKWSAAARSRQLQVVVGGSLGLDSLELACQLKPDVLAVRTAVCESDRKSKISLTKIVELKAKIAACQQASCENAEAF